MWTPRDALRLAHDHSMEWDHRVFLMGEEVGAYQGAYKISQGLFDKYGAKRVIDTPITEYGFTGLAVGAAFKGLRPIVEFMTFNFAMQAIDHIVNSAAKTRYMSGGEMSCPIVFRGPNGSAQGVGAQHSQCFASWYAHCPGLIVLSPYTADDHYMMLLFAIQSDHPVVFLENEVLYGRRFERGDAAALLEEVRACDVNHLEHPCLKARVLKEGTHVTIVSHSLVLERVLQAAAAFEEMHPAMTVEVIDLRSLRPLDTATIVKSVAKTHRLVLVEEGWLFAGIAAEISAYVSEHAFDELDAPILRVGPEDVPLPYAKNLEFAAWPQVENITKALREVCHGI